MILRHRFFVANHFAEHGLGVHPQNCCQLLIHRRHHRVIIHLQQLGLHRASDKCTQQDSTVRGAIRKLAAGKTDSQNLSLFHGRNDKPEGVHLMCEIGKRVAADDDRAGCVFDCTQQPRQRRKGLMVQKLRGHMSRLRDNDSVKQISIGVRIRGNSPAALRCIRGSNVFNEAAKLKLDSPGFLQPRLKRFNQIA